MSKSSPKMNALVFLYDFENDWKGWTLYKRFTDYESAVKGVADAPNQLTVYMIYEKHFLLDKAIYRAAASPQLFDAYKFARTINGSDYLISKYIPPFQWCLEAKGMPFMFTTELS